MKPGQKVLKGWKAQLVKILEENLLKMLLAFVKLYVFGIYIIYIVVMIFLFRTYDLPLPFHINKTYNYLKSWNSF